MITYSKFAEIGKKFDAAFDEAVKVSSIAFPVVYMIGGVTLMVMASGVIPFALGFSALCTGIGRSSFGVAKAIKMAVPKLDPKTLPGKVIEYLKKPENRIFVNACTHIMELAAGLTLCSHFALAATPLAGALLGTSFLMICAGGIGMLSNMFVLAMFTLSQKLDQTSKDPIIKIPVPSTLGGSGSKVAFNATSDNTPTMVAQAGPVTSPNLIA